MPGVISVKPVHWVLEKMEKEMRTSSWIRKTGDIQEPSPLYVYESVSGSIQMKETSSVVLSDAGAWRWRWERATSETQEHSEHHLLVHQLLNHSFKATQLKSGSFRVTVDGVPKALDILHKEKNNLSVSKGCYEERCWSSNKNLSKIPVSKKLKPKPSGSSTFWKSN